MGSPILFDDRAAAEKSAVGLMLESRQDNEEAFQVLYTRYHRRLHDFFYGLCRNPQSSSDLCQETFLRVWRLRARYAATGSFESYLFTIARNIWLEHRRVLAKRARLGFPTSLDEHFAGLRAPGDHPLKAAKRSEANARIFEALDALPEEQRMVFVLRTIEGLSLGEIASIMRCPVNTVRSRKLLAVKKLRETLRKTFHTSRL